MLHVLRHYIPLRTALLIATETVLITFVVFAVLSSHLFHADEAMRRALAGENLSPEQAIWRCLFSSVLASVLAQTALAFNELYDFRVSSSPYERAARFLGSAGSAVLLVTLAIGLTRLWEVERVLDFPGLSFSQTAVLVAIALGVAFVLLYASRNLFHALVRRSRFDQRLLVFGSGPLAERLTVELTEREDTGYRVVAVVPPSEVADVAAADRSSSAPQRGPAPAPRTRVAGSPGTLALKPRLLLEPDDEPDAARTAPTLSELAAGLEVTDIVVALQERRARLPMEQLLRCRLDGIVVHEAEALFERLTGKLPVEGMHPSYLIFNRGFAQHPLNQLAKRVFDIVCSVALLLVTWPVMLAAALAIRLESPGSILFRQERVGQDGRTFTLCKFRSMRENAEAQTGPVWAQEDDPRITRVGGFLRHSRIDELPQLFNVLGGTMSFVGPRPERPSFVEELSRELPFYGWRHTIKPGITGWAQINYPYGNSVEDALHKLQYDLFYIKHSSLLFDASIVLNTVKTVVLRKGT